jgi:hypothetical protein
MASSFLRFLDHVQRRTTVGRTPLNEWSAHRRDLYLTTHNRQTSVPPVGFELMISAGERPQTYALDRAATGPGTLTNIQIANQTFQLYCDIYAWRYTRNNKLVQGKCPVVKFMKKLRVRLPSVEGVRYGLFNENSHVTRTSGEERNMWSGLSDQWRKASVNEHCFTGSLLGWSEGFSCCWATLLRSISCVFYFVGNYSVDDSNRGKRPKFSERNLLSLCPLQIPRWLL